MLFRSYDGKLNIKDGEIQTSKKYEMDEHGVGIKNIIEVITEYCSISKESKGTPSILNTSLYVLYRLVGYALMLYKTLLHDEPYRH